FAVSLTKQPYPRGGFSQTYLSHAILDKSDEIPLITSYACGKLLITNRCSTGYFLLYGLVNHGGTPSSSLTQVLFDHPLH
ncbi:MAG TPA: hypothetical protein PLR71_09665, partial [Deltaproteobacteria bacterium]|nr:hypothetical protein [Deltaproteobacteria bacterium]